MPTIASLLLLCFSTFLPLLLICAHRGLRLWTLQAVAPTIFRFFHHLLSRLFFLIQHFLSFLSSLFQSLRFSASLCRCFPTNVFLLSDADRSLHVCSLRCLLSVDTSSLHTTPPRSALLPCLSRKGVLSLFRRRLAGIPCCPLVLALIYSSFVSPSLFLSGLSEETPGSQTFIFSVASLLLSGNSAFPCYSKHEQLRVVGAPYRCHVACDSPVTCNSRGWRKSVPREPTTARVSIDVPSTITRWRGQTSECASGLACFFQLGCLRSNSCKRTGSVAIFSDFSGSSSCICAQLCPYLRTSTAPSALIIKYFDQYAYLCPKSFLCVKGNTAGCGLTGTNGAQSTYPLSSKNVDIVCASGAVGYLSGLTCSPSFSTRRTLKKSPAIIPPQATTIRLTPLTVALLHTCYPSISVSPTKTGGTTLFITSRRSTVHDVSTSCRPSRLCRSNTSTAGFLQAARWRGLIGSHTKEENRTWRRHVGTTTAQERRVDTPYDIHQSSRWETYTRRQEQATTGKTQLYASLLSRRRLKIHDAEKIHKVLRRGVPLRFLDVSGNVHLPGHIFNPVKVLRFGGVLDRFLDPYSPSLSAADGGSLLRFLSTHARSRNGDAASSYAAAAYQLRRVVSALLSTVHPVLLCMYTRWLRLQEQPPTPTGTEGNTAERYQPQQASALSLTSSSVSPALTHLPSFSSFAALSPRMPSASSSTFTAFSPQQHRIIACSDTESKSNKESSVLTTETPSTAADVHPIAGGVSCSERLALAIEGGAMRGCVTAGMAAALHHMGYADVFDAVYGSSAGSLIGAYFLSRQLPYEGAQIYYDWLPYMGKKFLDMKRLGKGLGLGFLLDADVLGFLKKKNGSPLINLDVLLHDVVQRRQPLDWEKFKRQDQHQPLKVIASGLHSQRAVVLESAAGNFDSVPTFLDCLRASMLMPGLAGPAVHVHMLSRSCTRTSMCDFSARVEASDSDKTTSGFTSSSSHESAVETNVSAPSSVQSSSSVDAATSTIASAASSSLHLSRGVSTTVAVTHDAVSSFPPTNISSSSADHKRNPTSAIPVTGTSSEFLARTEDSAYSSSVSEYSPFASSVAHRPLSFSSSSSASYISEPLADALLYEPIPYRSALLQGYNRVLVLRSRPDGIRVGRLSGLEAAIENRVVSRFFGETHLRHVHEYVKQRRHRIRYMDDMLLLNEASNSRKLLRVIQELEPQHQEHVKNVQELDGFVGEQQQALEGYAFAVSLPRGCAEVAKTSLKRSKILQGIRDGFARLYDVLVPDPAQRGKGMEEASKVFPEDLPRVTDALMASDGEAAAVVQRLPPAYDDSAEKQQMEVGVLGQYVLQAALAQDPHLVSYRSSIIFASATHGASAYRVGDAAAVVDSPSLVTKADGRSSLCEPESPEQQQHQNI